MSISPGRLLDVQGVADPVAALQDNMEYLTEELFKWVSTYQNGTETTIVGPPTSGAHILDERWKDAYFAEYICSVAGTPGTWLQFRPGIANGTPASGTIPTGYLLVDASDNLELKKHAGAYAWNDVYISSASIDALTDNRLTKVNGSALANSIVRDDGTFVSVGADANLGQLVFQVTGGISLIGASTLKTSTGNLIVATGATNGDIFLTPHGTGKVAIGSSSPTNAALEINTTITGGSESYFLRTLGTVNANANERAGLARFGGTIVEASTGTHDIIFGVSILAPTITGAGAAVGDTAVLYINDAMSASVSGANYALWVDSGACRFDGSMRFGTHTALGSETLSGFITITDAGGTTRKLAVIS